MPLISLRDVTKVYPARKRGAAPLTAVRGVNLDIEAGEICGIVGYSGAGKSTLVRLINQLEPITSGEIAIDDIVISKLSERAVRKERTNIGMIFQQFNLLHSRTVWGNVAYPLEVVGMPKAEQQQRISDLLYFVGLADKAHEYPEALSGGQKQRVGIARALAASPRILLADEATSALDPETTHEVLELLAKVNRELGITIVVITHEMEVVTKIAHKVAVMERGEVVEYGDTYDVFTAPKTNTGKKFVQTVVRALPSGEELAALRAQHPGRFVTLAFTDEASDQGRVFAHLAAAGLDVALVHGGVNAIRGRTYGLLTIAIQGDAHTIDASLATLDPRITVTEIDA
ncbi:methionine ABC transporter ATP-binding protein [Humidisolicoccus flavus]|uniref:methionine ABC transporter ATP-binding protein n=1 Tax=Humidisolicoccus flavus TaxID=3111414 RepID=UPI00324EDC29